MTQRCLPGKRGYRRCPLGDPVGGSPEGLGSSPPCMSRIALPKKRASTCPRLHPWRMTAYRNARSDSYMTNVASATASGVGTTTSGNGVNE